jgi:hypothetical protein
MAWADANLAPGSVVLSDPVTSYAVPMMTREYVVTLLDQHSSPCDARAERRLLDARDALDPFGDWKRAGEILREYRVDAVALNDRFAEVPPADYWGPSHAWFTAARARLDREPAVFEPVLDHGDFVLYRVHRERLGALDAPATARSFVRAYRPGDDPIARRLGPGLPQLVALALSPRRAAPGDTVRGLIRWMGEGGHAPGSYQAIVRFDRGDLGGWTPPRMFGKPARKLLEKLRHQRYRFRESHLPVRGTYGVDLWRAGDVVSDSFQVVVPPDAAPGVYDVRVGMIRQPHYPNLRVSDYFFDDDSFAGALAGRIEVTGASGAPAGAVRRDPDVRH